MARKFFDIEVTAPQFAAMLNIREHVPAFVQSANNNVGRMVKRVKGRGLDAEGRPLPKYRVKTQDGSGEKWKLKEATAPKRGVKFDEDVSALTKSPKNIPPEIFQIIRQHPGCVVKPKSAIRKKPSKATPLRYKGGTEQVKQYERTVKGRQFKTVVHSHKRKSVSQVAGKNARHIWGWMWPNKAAFMADMYGGSKVNYTRTNTMWKDLRMTPRLKAGRFTIIHRFRGTNPRGLPSEYAAKYSGKKRMPSSYKAVLTNRRDSKGMAWGGVKHKWKNPRVWFYPTKEEGQQMLKEMSEYMGDAWKGLPTVRVTTKGGGASTVIVPGKKATVPKKR